MNGAAKSPNERPQEAARSVMGDVRALWTLAGPTPERAALIRFAAIVALVIAANTWGQIRLNEWQGAFFDAIGRRDLAGFFDQLVVFAEVVGALLVLVVAQTWLAEHIKVRLRGVLTRALLAEWLQPRRAYLLQYASATGEHPDQRVHEDTRHLAELATDLGIGLVQAGLLLVSFVGVLWRLSSDMAVTIGGGQWTIPGYMVWFALAYSLAGSLLTTWVGRPLVRLNADRYAREADLRFVMVRIDESAQSMALNRREADELGQAKQALEGAQEVGRRLANAVARLTFVTSTYGWGTLVAPVIAAMPAYFSGSMSLGGLMMVIGAFGQVQQALRWSVDNYSRIADARATLGRVSALASAFAGVSGAPGGQHVSLETWDSDSIAIEDLCLVLPDGTSRLDENPVTIAPGDHVRVVGDPGSGKSLLFLALAGLWSQGSGTIRLPARDSVLFMPERPHLPTGALRDAITPAGLHPSRDEIVAALDRVGLGHLAAHLDREARWDRELHVEEQQGVALARLLLTRPNWVIMDEALSAYRDGRRRTILATLGRELPGTAFLGTGLPDQENGFWTRSVTLTKTPAACRPGQSARAPRKRHSWEMPP